MLREKVKQKQGSYEVVLMEELVPQDHREHQTVDSKTNVTVNVHVTATSIHDVTQFPKFCSKSERAWVRCRSTGALSQGTNAVLSMVSVTCGVAQRFPAVPYFLLHWNTTRRY